MQFGLISVAMNSLQNSQAGMRATSSNISNASVEGYNRQSVEFKSAGSVSLGSSGFIGNGAVISRISRVYSSFLQAQVTGATSAVNKDEAMQRQIDSIDNLLGNMNTGLSTAMSSFAASASALAGTPTSPTQRDSFLSSASFLANKFQEAAKSLQSSATSVNSAIEQSISEINAATSGIAKLNTQMISMSQDMIPSEMLDERDRMVTNLSALVGVKVINGRDGSFGIYTSGGQPLVMGVNWYQMRASNESGDPNQSSVGFTDPGLPRKLSAESIGGGKLGGLLEFRDTQLINTSNEIGRIATVIVSAINDQSRRGQTESGAAGANLFTIGNPASYSFTDNTGNASLGAAVSDASALTGNDYLLEFDGAGWVTKILPDGVNGPSVSLPAVIDGVSIQVQSGTPSTGDKFTIQPTRLAAVGMNLAITDPRRLPTGMPVYASESISNKGYGIVSAATVTVEPWPANIKTAGTVLFTAPDQWTFNGSAMTVQPGNGKTDVGINGWSFSIAGVPSDGDSFDVSVNKAGGDGGNMQIIANLATNPTSGGATSPANSFSRLVAKIGGYSQATTSALSAHTSLLDSATTQQQDMSGVNLDEETTKLVQMQQTYQAAAKIIQIAMSLFETIIALR